MKLFVMCHKDDLGDWQPFHIQEGRASELQIPVVFPDQFRAEVRDLKVHYINNQPAVFVAGTCYIRQNKVWHFAGYGDANYHVVITDESFCCKL